MATVDETLIVAHDFEEEINFIEVDGEEIMKRLLERFEFYLGETLHAGDERRIFLQGLAYVLADEANHINETGRGNILKYATGAEIDAIAQLYSNTRLQAEYATVKMNVTISDGIGRSITIPKGTRVTADGIYLFSLDEDVMFESGKDTTKSVSATAVEAGASYNGFLTGQINRIVDSNPYVKSVVNTTVSTGGTDIETDDEFKERLKTSPFSFAVAGPAEAYRSIAMAVSNSISDVHVYSPSAGVVEIAVILDSGEIPDSDAEILDEILSACSDRTVRPLTDYVQVVPAQVVPIAIDAVYYVANGDTSVIPAIVEAVEKYKEWQTSKIGRDVNPDHLRKLMIDAGAARLDILAPSYLDIKENEIAQIVDVAITYGGSIKE